MKHPFFSSQAVVIMVAVALFMIQCSEPAPQALTSYKLAYQVQTGNPVNVMLTAFSTTLVANGTNFTNLRIALSDTASRQILDRTDTVQVFIFGDGMLTNEQNKPLALTTDSTGAHYATCVLSGGISNIRYTTGTQPGKVKIEARCGKLWPGAHEIHLIPANVALLTPTPQQLPATTLPIDRMIGADISFLPELENKGQKFYYNGIEVDALNLLQQHGINYIRLRLFVNPENPKGYSPEKGYCNLPNTLAFAKRVKDAGLNILLDFHYSDYWADPQQQNKPLAWQNCSFEQLTDSVKNYTIKVLEAFKAQGLMPEMIQIGNEINHGMLWPDGHISNPDQLAELLKAGIEGARSVDANVPLMMHVALGGQNQEAVFWFDNMVARGVEFDIIGLSYYARWHGTLDDLNFNLNDLIKRYNKPVNVVEYNDFKKEVHDISFGLPNGMGKGACVWEPLSWNTNMVANEGRVTDVILIYDALRKSYLP